MSQPQATSVNSREQQEVLALLHDELQEQLDSCLDDSMPEAPDELSAVMQRRACELERLQNAAELIGLNGLAQVCRTLHVNLSQMAPPDEEQLLLATSWPACLLDYVQQLQASTSAEEAVTAMLEFLSEPAWPSPLQADAQSELAEQLLNPDWHALEPTPEEASGLPREASLDMLSLAITDDINPRLYEGLMLELPAQIEQFSESLDQFLQGLASGDQRRSADALNRAQRIAHTVKGSANVVGVKGLANFMHYSEDFLDLLEHGTPTASRALSDLLMQVADTAASLLDHLQHDTAPDREELHALQALLDGYHALRTGEWLPGNTEPPPLPVSSGETPRPLPESSEPANAEPPPVNEAAETQVRVAERHLDSLLTQAGETSIGNHRLVTQTHRARERLQSLMGLQQKLGQLTEELGQLIELRNLFARPGDDDSQALDPLELDRYNELHSFYHQLQEYAADANDLLQDNKRELASLDDLLQQQQRHHRSTQEELLGLLSVPADTLQSRLERCVRQACRLTDKRATLTLEGGQTQLDRNVLQQLADPLMHLLRNAVDHGIESPEQRQTSGKPAEGQLTLRIMPDAQNTRLILSDDGAGLNRQRIIERGRALGLTPPENDIDEWLNTLIFRPGFSTREAVSQTSGRGVGLDAVARDMAAMQGEITCESAPGRGTTWTLRIPNRLIAEHQLLVEAGGTPLALSSRGIQQVLFMNANDLSNDRDQLLYRYEQTLLPTWHLSQIAPMPSAPVADTREAQAVLVVGSGQNRRALLVDRILASREMVVKPLPQHCPDLPGILGATILGDGAVAPVLDTAQLLSIADSTDTGPQPAHAQGQPAGARARPLALIVDDSLSTRRSLSEFVGELGMEVATARDGFEAIEVLQHQTPTLVLVDMEMPRMNGLEFTAHLRAQSALKDLPVIMITSRNTEKHRALAESAGVDRYLNKPFSEVDLLNSIESSLSSPTNERQPT